MDGDDDRLSKLEAELAFQGETLRELNEALSTQQRDLLLLRRQLTLLVEELRELRSERRSGPDVEGAMDAGTERPPHY